ncbi:hypothetical protein OROMI_003855 [Orobanche minor]
MSFLWNKKKKKEEEAKIVAALTRVLEGTGVSDDNPRQDIGVISDFGPQEYNRTWADHTGNFATHENNNPVNVIDSGPSYAAGSSSYPVVQPTQEQGTFSLAYDEAALKFRGNKAKLNFPDRAVLNENPVLQQEPTQEQGYDQFASYAPDQGNTDVSYAPENDHYFSSNVNNMWSYGGSSYLNPQTTKEQGYAPPFQGNIAASYGTSYDAGDQYHRGNFAILDGDNFFDSNVNSGSYGGSSSLNPQATEEQGYAPPFQGNIAVSYGASYDAGDQYHRGNFAILDSDNFFDSNVNSGSYGGSSSLNPQATEEQADP